MDKKSTHLTMEMYTMLPKYTVAHKVGIILFLDKLSPLPCICVFDPLLQFYLSNHTITVSDLLANCPSVITACISLCRGVLFCLQELKKPLWAESN